MTLCTCTHAEQLHDLGKRAGKTVRTGCSHQDEAGYCPCVLFQADGHVEWCPTCKRPVEVA